MQEIANISLNNVKDIYGNTGYGQWLRVPNTTIWYFYAGDINQTANQTQGFLSNGWYNLGWNGQDCWYRFNTDGIMQLGWYQEEGKIYFLQNDLNDKWYGRSVTGSHNIGGKIYNL